VPRGAGAVRGSVPGDKGRPPSGDDDICMLWSFSLVLTGASGLRLPPEPATPQPADHFCRLQSRIPCCLYPCAR